MSDGTERAAISRRLTLAVAIPVGLLVGVGAVLWTQIGRMTDLALWVDHSDQVISHVYDLQKQLADQESAVRGFLLSEDRVFLEPYEHAQPRIVFAELKDLVADNPPQQSRVEEALRRYETWLQDTGSLADHDTPLPPFRTRAALEGRRRSMERIRNGLVEMQRIELGLRAERVAASSAANRAGVMWAALLFVALTLGIAFVTRSQLTAVADTYASVLSNERATHRTLEDQHWIRSEHMKLAKSVQGDLTLERIGEHTLEGLAPSIRAVVGAFYVAEADGFRRHALATP